MIYIRAQRGTSWLIALIELIEFFELIGLVALIAFCALFALIAFIGLIALVAVTGVWMGVSVTPYSLLPTPCTLSHATPSTLIFKLHKKFTMQ